MKITKHLMVPLLALCLGATLAQDSGSVIAPTNQAGQAANQELSDLRTLLMEDRIATGSTQDLIDAFDEWRGVLTARGSDADIVIADAVDSVTNALAGDPFDRDEAKRAFTELALIMRTVASDDVPDEESLLVEMASLVNQAAGLLASTDFMPRMDVETP